MNNQLEQVIAIALEASSIRKDMTYGGDPIEPSSLADTHGYLPIFAATTHAVSKRIGLVPPSLVLAADPDAAFGYALTGVGAGSHGLAAFLLALNYTIRNASPEVEAYLDALADYINDNPDHIHHQPSPSPLTNPLSRPDTA